MLKRICSSRRLVLLLSLLLAACAPQAQPGTAQAPSVGPESGTLLIAGGGHLGSEIMERFVELAGGTDASIVVIPTAGGAPSYSEDWSGLHQLRRVGATNLTVLHTYDREVADSEEFVAPLRHARGVWFPGGRQWRLADTYLDTRTHEEILALLQRGGVVGGTSAGASIQASYLVRGAPEGNHIVMAPGHERGLGLLRNSAIDQHLLVRNRQNDLLQVIAIHPDLLGIGIDEGTAIVVQNDQFEVIGESKVAVYGDGSRTDGAGYLLLSAGDRYDLRARRVVSGIPR